MLDPDVLFEFACDCSITPPRRASPKPVRPSACTYGMADTTTSPSPPQVRGKVQSRRSKRLAGLDHVHRRSHVSDIRTSEDLARTMARSSPSAGGLSASPPRGYVT